LTDLLIKGGTVYTPDGPREADVHVDDGVITAVGPAASTAHEGVVDATGMYVLPGGIDVHVHSRDPGFPQKEDFGTLTAAAAAGGVTTVIDMPNTVPAVDAAGVLEAKVALARRKARVDFGLWALIRSTSTVDDLEQLAAAGATGFKAYLGYAFNTARKQVMYSPDSADPDLEAPPDYGTLARLAPAIAELRLPLLVHAEDPAILSAFRRPLETYEDLLAARPAEAEAIAISAVAEIAGSSGVRAHIVHISSAAGLAAAREAVRAGAPLTLETCPQYLWRCDADFESVGMAMKMFPPIRHAADRDALIAGLADGPISIVGSDHAPHTDEEKGASLEDAASGSPGVQTLYTSCLELAQRMGDVWRAPRWVSEAPARLAGLGESKGAIAVGYDADLVVVDPRSSTVVQASQMRSRQRHGVLDGLRFGFSVREVFVRGAAVATEGRKVGRAAGRFVRPVGGAA
jgi:allantoinase